MSMTSTDDFHTPRARAIINAATALHLDTKLIIECLQMNLGGPLSYEYPGNALYAIADPLFSGEDDFDDLIHELDHILGFTIACEKCGKCSYPECCTCDY